MKEVILHVYDVTNSDSEKTNNTILQINRIFKDRIGLGGIFHSAIQVYGEEEWSFGFCDHGSGVFSCPPGKNTMYTYREKIVLGETDFSNMEFNQIIRELSREWPGNSYDLLAKNCNHFCDIFCDRLGVPKLPGWVNRFANAGDTAIMAAGNAAVKFRQAKSEIVNASRVAYRFMAGLTTSNNTATITNNNNNNNINSNSNSNNNNGNDANTPESEIPKFQSMFKSMVSPKQNKPANSSSVPDTDESVGTSINADTDKLYSLKPRQASFQSDDESSAANLRGKE